MEKIYKSFSRKIVSLIDFCFDSVGFLYQPELKCPICKLNSENSSVSCVHCGFEYSELEKKEQFKKYKILYFRSLIIGLVFFGILISIVYYLYFY